MSIFSLTRLQVDESRRWEALRFARRFTLPWEGHSLQFRFESFNFTNSPIFGTPNTSINNAAAATINTADEPRRIQFGLKYVF